MSVRISQRWRKWFSPSLEHLKSIHIQFNPWDSQANGIKEFYFQIQNRKLIRSNPKCDITSNINNNREFHPFVRFEYKDSTKFDYPASGKNVNQILFAMALQNEYLINKKGLGDEQDMNDEEDEDGDVKK